MLSKNTIKEKESLLKNLLVDAIEVADDFNWAEELDKAHSNFSGIIFKLMRKRDAKRSIEWKVTTNQKTIIRDATDVKPYNGPDIEGFQILAINCLRGALELSDDEHPIDYKIFEEPFKRFISASQKVTSAEELPALFKQFYDSIIIRTALHFQISPKEAIARLSLARDFANFNDENKDVITINELTDSRNGKIDFFQADFARSEMSEDLKIQYKNRHQKPWYKMLPAWQKKLVDKHVKDILDGKIIPTQLRGLLPGLRNTYKHMNGVIDSDGSVHILHEDYHAATVAYLGKDKEIAKLNIEQVAELGFGGIMSLNSPVPLITKEDVKLVNELEKTVKTHNKKSNNPITYSNLPLNAGRYLLNIKPQAINELLKKICEKAILPETFDPKILNFISGKLSHSEGMQQALQNLRNADLDLTLKQLLESAIFLRDLMNEKNDSYIPFNDSDDVNLQLATFTIIADYHLSLLDPTHKPLLYGCLSGKDRTGILLFYIDLIEAMHVIEGKYFTESALNTFVANAKRLALSEHLQILPALNGGSIGAYGIKKDTENAIPERLHPIKDLLLLETASYNKGLKLSKSIENIYELRRELFLNEEQEQLYNLLHPVDTTIPFTVEWSYEEYKKINEFKKNNNVSQQNDLLEELKAIAADSRWTKENVSLFHHQKAPDGISSILKASNLATLIHQLENKQNTFTHHFYNVTGIRSKLTNEFYILIVSLKNQPYENALAAIQQFKEKHHFSEEQSPPSQKQPNKI